MFFTAQNKAVQEHVFKAVGISEKQISFAKCKSANALTQIYGAEIASKVAANSYLIAAAKKARLALIDARQKRIASPVSPRRGGRK